MPRGDRRGTGAARLTDASRRSRKRILSETCTRQRQKICHTVKVSRRLVAGAKCLTPELESTCVMRHLNLASVPPHNAPTCCWEERTSLSTKDNS
jgi:hypothetical protein